MLLIVIVVIHLCSAFSDYTAAISNIPMIFPVTMFVKYVGSVLPNFFQHEKPFANAEKISKVFWYLLFV